MKENCGGLVQSEDETIYDAVRIQEMNNGLFIKTDDFTFISGPPLKWLHASDCQENITTSFGSLSGTNLTFTSRIPLNGYKVFGSYRMVIHRLV